MSRMGLRKKNQGLSEMGQLEEKNCRHLGIVGDLELLLPCWLVVLDGANRQPRVAAQPPQLAF